jgi:DNA polymerase elongation subunit (family B)
LGKVTIAEDDGLELLHALTDSLWIKKEGLTEAELASICRKITAATNVEMEFEGRYHWIVFARSKQNSKRPVAARCFGVFTDGSPKIRGLARRRAETPKFIKAVQEGLLSIASERSLDTLARQA